MLVVLRFVAGAPESAPGAGSSSEPSSQPSAGAVEDFLADVREGLAILAAQPGYLSGQLGRAIDDPAIWCLVMQWESVGTYRRALSGQEVRMRATALLARAASEVSAFESLMIVDPGGGVAVPASDLAGAVTRRDADADCAGSDAPGR